VTGTFKLKQLLFLNVPVTFIFFAFIAPGFADEHFPFLAQVSKESVNVRAGPNTNFEKIDKLDKGAQVVVIGRSYEWLKVQPLSTTRSYIRSDYLKISPGGDIALVVGNNVNVRSQPNSDAATLGEVKKGTVVRVLEQAQGWCRLAPVAGTAAWIHQDFLEKISDDIPASLALPVMQWPSEASGSNAPEIIKIEHVSLQGKLQALPQAPQADVHYEIVIDDKTAYYMEDIPQISFFDGTVVDVDGTVIPDPQKKWAFPLVHITKIALVL
jgi:SH3-like domain-containing protein